MPGDIGAGDGDADSDGDGDADSDGDADADEDGDADEDEGSSDGDADGDRDGPEADAEPDAPRCRSPICDVLPQCGCPEGRKCVETGAGTTTCALAGGGPAGATCLWELECEVGTTCAGFVDDDLRLCHRYCDDPADCAALGASSRCVLTWEGIAARACSNPCDATTAAPCPEGVHCLVTPDPIAGWSQAFATCGARAGPGEEGAPCGDVRDCGRALACVDDRCRRFCVMGREGDCPPPAACTGLVQRPMLGEEEIGSCL